MPLLASLFIGFILIFLCSRFIVGEVDLLAKRAHFSKFGLSFLLLGALTSLTEIFVAISSQISGVPEIYAGNLIGGIFVISLCIIPLLAMFKGGLTFGQQFSRKKFIGFGLLNFLPILVAFDGVIFRSESIVLLIAYTLFIYYELFSVDAKSRVKNLFTKRNAITFGALLLASTGIYFGSQLLVSSTESLAILLGVPMFVVSLFLLSFGTNIPELSIALSSILKKNTDIAFGDYFGSASFNVFLLGLFGVMNPYFAIDLGSGALLPLFIVANTLFLLFGMTKKRIGRFEAILLLIAFFSISFFEVFFFVR